MVMMMWRKEEEEKEKGDDDNDDDDNDDEALSKCKTKTSKCAVIYRMSQKKLKTQFKRFLYIILCFSKSRSNIISNDILITLIHT